MMQAGRSQRPVRVALAGAGQFGVTLAAGLRGCAAARLVAVADLDTARAVRVLAASAPPSDAGGEVFVDPLALAGCDCDVVVEATGHPETGARLAAAAIEQGRHVVMVSKEVESVVGPELAARARRAGVVYSMVEGDQPSLLVGLIRRARRMGLTVVGAGKSTEYDFVWSPQRDEVAVLAQRITAPALAQDWHLGESPAGALARRAQALAALPGRSSADLCEIAVTANAVQLLPGSPDLVAPHLRSLEIPDVFRPLADGGVLEAGGTLGLFQCLRRDDEAGFAGGVFVVVEWPAGETAGVLAGKGMPTSRDGRLGLLHNPVHLLGVESLVSILDAAQRGEATAQAERPLVDLVAVAQRRLEAGSVLAMGGHFHEIQGCDARLVPAGALDGATPVPYHLASNATLTRDVPAGSVLVADDLVEPADSFLWSLRRAQDARFGLR
jgi:predicted homoserine dehydrogenase-like protein